MRFWIVAVAVVPALVAQVSSSRAQMVAVTGPSDLHGFNVTIRRFDLGKGPSSGTEFVLPVDSPDAEHACASTLANAAAFSKKVDSGKPLPLAFTCTKIEKR